jgi:hypothetical protein
MFPPITPIRFTDLAKHRLSAHLSPAHAREQFGNSFVNGLGFSLGVATTYAIFSSIDWDDDDDWDHHHDDDWDNHGGYNRNGDNNININVENFNKISGQRLTDANRTWQHNPAYREGVPYPTNQLNTRFHSTNTATGLSSTQQKPVNRDSQRQAALSQMEKSTGKTFPQTARTGTKDVQRQASGEQLKQISQRNNYRGYDTKPQTAKRTTTQQRENRQTPETGETGFAARAATRSPAAKQSAPGQCAERQRQPLRELAGAAAARCAKQTACCAPAAAPSGVWWTR